MTEYLVIRLPATPDEPVSWLVADNTGQPLAMPESDGLGEAVRRAQQRPVLALVPGEQVLVTRANLPVRGASRMLAAVPYALEEHLADDISQLHFAVGRREPGGQVPVAVVEHALMAAWNEQLAAAGIEALTMLPDTLGVPVHEGYTVVMDQARCLLRAPNGDVLVADTGSLATFIQAMGARPEDAPADSHLYISESDAVTYSRVVAELRMVLPELDVHDLRNGPFPVLAAGAVSATGPNLLQGHYARSTNSEKYWKPWRNAAVLAGLFVITALGVKATEVIALKGELRELNTQLNEIASQTLGGKVVDPMRQLEQRVSALRSADTGGGSPFLEILETLGGVLGNVSGATIGKLDYRNGTMDLTLTAPDVDTLDRIRSGVEAGGLDAEIQSANQRDIGVQGRLRISGRRS